MYKTLQKRPERATFIPKGCSGKFIEDSRIACAIVIVVVALGLDPEVVEVHVVPSNDAGQELVEGDVLGHRGHDPTAFLIKGLVIPMRIHSLEKNHIHKKALKFFPGEVGKVRKCRKSG